MKYYTKDNAVQLPVDMQVVLKIPIARIKLQRSGGTLLQHGQEKFRRCTELHIPDCGEGLRRPYSLPENSSEACVDPRDRNMIGYNMINDRVCSAKCVMGVSVCLKGI